MRWLGKNIWQIAWWGAVVVVVGMWVRGYLANDGLYWFGAEGSDGVMLQQSGFALQAGAGRVGVTWGRQWFDEKAFRHLHRNAGHVPPPDYSSRRPGWNFVRTTDGTPPEFFVFPFYAATFEDPGFWGTATVRPVPRWQYLRQWAWRWEPSTKRVLGAEFAVLRALGPDGRDEVVVIVPYWLMLAGLVIPIAIARWRRSRWRRPGECRRCGYDLRAHATGERCPECGTVKG